MGIKKVKDMNQEEIISELRLYHFCGDLIESKILTRVPFYEFNSEISKNGRLESLQDRLEKLLRRL